MNKSLLHEIDCLIEEAKEDIVNDIIQLIRIESVKGAPLHGAPFGPGPKAMLDAVLSMGKKEGFVTTDYHVGVVSLALKNGQPDLGIWLHGDVVPAGSGWTYPPFKATLYKNCIIGRGANDNKGQLVALFHLLKIFKKLDVQLNYNPALYVGSDEENGMHDLTGIPGNEDAKGFCNVCNAPKISLVPDSAFPVCYGGKGSATVTFKSNQPLHGLCITAGQEDSPGKAMATVYGKTIVTHSQPRHASDPDPNGNMITRLMEKLLDEGLAIDADRPVLEFFKLMSLDIHGDQAGINVPTETMRPLTVFAQRIDMVKGCPALRVNIRYPVEITLDEILQRTGELAQKYGLSIISVESTLEPYLLDPQWSVIHQLNDISNQIMGEDKKPYTLGGGTYAHKLPNALVYGINGCLRPEGFPTDRGNIHGIDELVSLNRLECAMKIYARALLQLNELDW